MEDDGHAISFKVLRPGTTVRSSDGVDLGTVIRVDEAARENIFDGIMVETDSGVLFLDAPEVARIAERAVTTTFTAADAGRYLQVPRPRRRPGWWTRVRARLDRR
jgi:hypothetical protein